MSPKKDLRTESSNKEAKMNFLECLTEDLIHRVLNFLNTAEETRFGLLSRRLRSSWLSFPSLNFDFTQFSRGSVSSNQAAEFFDYIHRSLQLRGPFINDQLKKLRFRYNGRHHYPLENDFEALVKRFIEFALENRAKELELDIRVQDLHFLLTRGGSDSFKKLLEPVFFLQCVTILKLKGFSFPEQDLDLSCPLVEDFTLETCDGLRSIRISSACGRLSKADIKHCCKLASVHVDAKHVESFSFMGFGVSGCVVDISACSNSLKNLTLGCAAVYEFLQQLDGYVVLRFLTLCNCNLPTTLNIGSFSLETLKLSNCNIIENLIVSSMNLESFTYHKSSNATCSIDISECTALKSLKLTGAVISASWLKDTISALTLLKKVTLNHCFSLENIEIKHNRLERLVVENFDSLGMVDIDARSLLQFSYSGQLEPCPVLITSSKCKVTISLEERTYALDRWFRNLSKFIAYFDHCPLLTLSVSSAEDLIFPKEYLWFSSFPLPDMKHLIVKLAELPNRATLVDLVESMLWIIPNPDTVTIVSGNKRYLLKFHFSDQENKNENANCCLTRPFKCWRHQVERIEMENFEEEDRKNLERLLFDGYLK